MCTVGLHLLWTLPAGCPPCLVLALHPTSTAPVLVPTTAACVLLAGPSMSLTPSSSITSAIHSFLRHLQSLCDIPAPHTFSRALSAQICSECFFSVRQYFFSNRVRSALQAHHTQGRAAKRTRVPGPRTLPFAVTVSATTLLQFHLLLFLSIPFQIMQPKGHEVWPSEVHSPREQEAGDKGPSRGSEW